jgi:hypothetical protein
MNYLEGKEKCKTVKWLLVTKSKKRQNGYYESLPSCVLQAEGMVFLKTM